MNSVLQQLLRGTGEKAHRSFDVSGSYLPGYGLLFVVTGDNSFLNTNFPLDIDNLKTTAIDFSMEIADSAIRAVDRAMKKYDSSMALYDSGMALHDSLTAPRVPRMHIRAPRVVVRDFSEKERKGLTKGDIGRIDRQVMTFLESYADAENRLSPAEHISVVFLTGSSSMARFYTVARSQISRFRSGSESTGAFRQNVKIDSLKNKYDSIDIMETILDKSIGSRMQDRHRFLFGPHSTGIYIKGLGAFFVCTMSDFPDFSEHENVKSDKHDISELENRIVRTIGTYGPSLSFLREDESILVSLQLNRFGAGNEQILVSLTKKAIDSYSRNETTFDTLRKEATIVQYR